MRRRTLPDRVRVIRALRHSHADMRLPLGRRAKGHRNDGNPCPRKNGTNVGTIQEFTLLCGLNVAGTILNTTDVDTLDECADACALTHPKCDGFSLNDGKCEMKGNIDTDKTHEAKGFNAAMGVFPSASSNCGKLGSTTTAGSTDFNVLCGSNIDGNDLAQNFAATFQDCLDQCTEQSGCGGISFDSSMSQGFQNCYMKGPAGSSKTVTKTGIDTAIVNNVGVAAPDPPNSSITPVPVTTVAPASAEPDPSTTEGGSFSTLSPTVSLIPETITSAFATASGGVLQTIATTEVITIAVTQTDSPLAASTAAPDLSVVGTKTWVAAPVIGSVAAVMVVAVAYVMWGRRHGRAAARPLSPFNKLPFLKRSKSSDAGSVVGRPQSEARSKLQSRDVPFGHSWRTG